MKKNIGFRSWFYFRQGWGSYFTFILGTTNTLVVTYYLAIQNIPTLNNIFPSFSYYAMTFVIIGIPLLVLIGYLHYKKTPAFSSEADVSHETNPMLYKLPSGWTSNVVYPLYYSMSDFMLKLLNNEKLTDEEIKELESIQNKIEILLKGGTVDK